MRLAFNRRLRTHCIESNRYLLDIADIEAHHSDDSPVTGKAFHDTTIEYLAPRYTFDTGHLNPKGQARAAKGLYALAAAIAQGR